MKRALLIREWRCLEEGEEEEEGWGEVEDSEEEAEIEEEDSEEEEVVMVSEVDFEEEEVEMEDLEEEEEEGIDLMEDSEEEEVDSEEEMEEEEEAEEDLEVEGEVIEEEEEVVDLEEEEGVEEEEGSEEGISLQLLLSVVVSPSHSSSLTYRYLLLFSCYRLLICYLISRLQDKDCWSLSSEGMYYTVWWERRGKGEGRKKQQLFSSSIQHRNGPGV